MGIVFAGFFYLLRYKAHVESKEIVTLINNLTVDTSLIFQKIMFLNECLFGNFIDYKCMK